METSCLWLTPAMFGDRERLLMAFGELQAFTFRYESGVCALRVCNSRGELIVLPFQGQQIWRAAFDGRDLTMRSMFDTPRSTRTYLENYGGFLIHCGFTAMGVPEAGDHHPLHGELPNAPYETAWLICGAEEDTAFMEVGGTYRHTVAFSTNYEAQPRLRVYAKRAVFSVDLQVHNLKNTSMEYMYLAHINFRPVNHGHLVYSAPYDPQHVRVRSSIPSHVRPQPGYREFLEALARDPQQHHLLAPDLAFDPEVVFFIDYTKDAAGWAHTLQLHPDGTADYVRHRPDQLDHGVRWICRTPDQDAIGIVLPATAEPEGYHAEKQKGNVKELAPQATWECQYWMGALNAQELPDVLSKFQQE